MFLLHERGILAHGPAQAHHPGVHVPDGGPDAVQQPRQAHVRGDPERVGHPGAGPDQGAAVAGDGEGHPAHPDQEPEDEGDRALARVPRERLVHLEAAPGQDPDGGGEGGERAGAAGDEEQGGRGQEARDRGGDSADHEVAQEDGAQYTRGGGDGAAEEQVPALAGDN